MTDIALRILLQAQNQASSVIKAVGGDLMAMNPLMGGVAVAGLAVAAGIAAIGVGSLKMAGDYQQGMNKVQALTGASSDQMSQYDQQLKALAVNAGVAPTALTDGLYNVLSASYKGADAMKVLTLATEDAKIGMTSSTVTTDALTNVLRSFGTKTQDITRVNGEMLQTVTLGKATFEQYATTIVKSASASTQFHVSMETMNAAWSTMTSSGIRAAQASTDYQQSLKVMYGNIGTVTKSLQKNGIAFDEAKFNTLDYGGKVQMLNQALDQANSKHVKVTGVTLQAAQAISTISKHIGDYHSNLAALSDKQATTQKTAQAWAITQGGFNQTMDRAKAAMQVLFITIGQQLLPIFTKIAAQVIPIITNFTQWLVSSGALKIIIGIVVGAVTTLINIITTMINIGSAVVNFFKNNQWAVDLLVAILITLAGIALAFVITAIPALVGGFIAWAVAAGTAALATLAAAAPFIIIGLIIAAVIFGIIMAVQHWSQIMNWIQGVIHVVTSAIGAFFSGVGTVIHNIVSGIGDAFSGLGTKVRGVWDGITGAIKSAINSIIGLINNFIDFIDGMQIHIPSFGVGPIQTPAINWNGLGIPHIPYLATGGYVQASGLAVIHQGETIVPARAVPLNSSSAAGGTVFNIGPIYANTKSDADAIAQRILQVLTRDLNRGGNLTTWTSGGRV